MDGFLVLLGILGVGLVVLVITLAMTDPYDDR